MSIILLLVVFFLLYLLQVMAFNRYWDKNLEVNFRFSNNKIFEGESTKFIEEIINNKIMPVWWLGVQIFFSRFIVFGDEKEFNPKAKETNRKDFFTLLSFEKFKKELKITACKRGYYSLDEIILSSGDLFNIYKFLESREYELHLTVYPRIISTPEIKLLLNKLSGDILTKRHIIEDPFTFRGIRSYTQNDSLKLVNWNATAKTGELKVNQYDYTASQELLIILNTESFNLWDSDVLIEESIRLAASIGIEGIKNGIPVGLISNSLDIVTKDEIKLSAKNGEEQIYMLLEALARLDTKKLTRAVEEIIEEEINKINRAYTIILISYYYDDKLIEKFKVSEMTNTNIHWVIPKIKNEEIKIELSDNLFIWEVSEDERRIL